MKPLVSIIVPIFNASDYLSICVESIINQSYKNIEIFLIDDGSNDDSYNLCKKYAGCDSRVMALHHENRGVSYTRNRGIQIANGEYICFIDSDDYVDKNFIEKMIEPLNKDDYDLIICRNFNCNKDGILEEVKVENGDFGDDLRDDYWKLNKFLGGPCLKLYRREIITKNNIRFLENVSYSEDRIFNTEFYSKIKRYSFVDLALYYVVNQNPYSLSKQKNLKTFQYAIDEAIMTANMLRREEFSEADSIITNHCIDIIHDFSINEEYNYKDYLDKIRQLILIIKYTPKCSLKRKVVTIFLKNGIVFPVYLYYKIKS